MGRPRGGIRVVSGRYAYASVRVPGVGPRRVYLGRVDEFRLAILRGLLEPGGPGCVDWGEVRWYFEKMTGPDTYTRPELAVWDALERGLQAEEMAGEARRAWGGKGGSAGR